MRSTPQTPPAFNPSILLLLGSLFVLFGSQKRPMNGEKTELCTGLGVTLLDSDQVLLADYLLSLQQMPTFDLAVAVDLNRCKKTWKKTSWHFLKVGRTSSPSPCLFLLVIFFSLLLLLLLSSSSSSSLCIYLDDVYPQLRWGWVKAIHYSICFCFFLLLFLKCLRRTCLESTCLSGALYAP